MKENLRVGVIGLGRAGEKHALSYHRMPFVRLAAVCDRDKDKLDRFCRKFGVKGYDDYRKLLGDDDIDAVSIVMPDDLHLDVTRAAVQTGKHILLEKPIAATLEDGKKIYSLVKDRKEVFMVAHILRFSANHALAKQSIARGDIGEIVHVSARRNSTFEGAMMYKGHHTDTHIHLLVHDADYLNWVIGSPAVKVFAKSREVILKPHGMRDTVLALVEYGNGALASLEGCWVLPGRSPFELDDRMEIVGTRGVLYLGGVCQGLSLVTDARVQDLDTRSWPEGNDGVGGNIYEELTAFVNCIVKNEKPLVGAREALEALFVVDAIDRSIREGVEVTIDYDGL